MRKIFFTLAAVLSLLAVHAQETNALKTEIENFEARTNTVIVKGFGQAGSVSVGAGTVLIMVKESDDTVAGHRMFGIAVELTGQNAPRQVAILDEVELAPLASGLDYLSKISSDASSLPAYVAEFKTRSGLRVAAHCSRRQGTIQYFLQFPDAPRVEINTGEIVQLKNAVSQALNTVNDLKSR
jgi:hypothetical protein